MEALSLRSYQIDPCGILSDIEIFSTLNRDVIEEISAHMKLIKINKHELLIEEGTHIDYIYFVFCGRLVAYKNQQGKNIKILGMISRGDSIGEMSLISNRRTVANVKATRQSLLVRLPRLQLENIINKHPSLARSLTEIILNRMERLIRRNQNENILSSTIIMVVLFLHLYLRICRRHQKKVCNI